MANVLQSGIASVERVFELLDADEQEPDAAEPLTDPRPRGRVEFDHVSFSYDPTPAHPGPVAGGRARPDGRHRGPHRRRQDHAGQPHHALLRARRRRHPRSTGSTSPRCARRELRSNIGMVLQDTWLFGGTIRDNIAYGNLDATEEQILEAARATLRRPLRALAARRLRHHPRRRGHQRQRRREAAPHHRPRLPRQPDDPHPRRGHQLGRHPHRGAHPGGDGGAALAAHQLRDRPPALHHPRRRHHPGDGRRADRGAGQPRRAARRGGAYSNLYNAQFTAAAAEVV